MAKLQVVSYSYTCDVCGAPIPESDGDNATHRVSWDGADYVLDVCVVHGSELGQVLAQLKGFVDAGHRETARRGRRSVAAASSAAPRASRGRRSSSSRSASGTGPKRGDLSAIRQWARDNGYQISERGRIPGALLAAYDEANSGSTGSGAAPAASPARKRRARKTASAASGG